MRHHAVVIRMSSCSSVYVKVGIAKSRKGVNAVIYFGHPDAETVFHPSNVAVEYFLFTHWT